MHVSGCCCFSDITILEGSVAMCSRFGGIFYCGFARNLLSSLLVKEFCESVSM